MTDLSDEAQAIVDATREADTPPASARERVKKSVLGRAALAAGAVSSATGAASAAAGSAATVGSTATMAAVKVHVTVAWIAASVALGGTAGVGVIALGKAPPAVTSVASRGLAPSLPTPRVAATAPTAGEIAVEPESAGAPLVTPEPLRPAPSSAGGAARSRPTLGAEIALLRDAREALRDDRPRRAIEILDEHARRFPSGVLGEERRAVRSIALCQAEPGAGSRAEATSFLKVGARLALGRSGARRLLRLTGGIAPMSHIQLNLRKGGFFSSLILGSLAACGAREVSLGGMDDAGDRDGSITGAGGASSSTSAATGSATTATGASTTTAGAGGGVTGSGGSSSSAGSSGGGGSSSSGGSSGGGGSSGNAGSGGAGGSSPGVCPASPPAAGAACTPPWMGNNIVTPDSAHCSWGDDPRPVCRTTALCSEGKWRITLPAASCSTPPLPAGCSTPPPASATTCSPAPQNGFSVSLACWYGDGTRCQCSACQGGADYPICRPIDPPQWACDKPRDNCPAKLPSAGAACTTAGLECGRDCDLSVRCEGGVWQWLRGACPICAAPDTRIATPNGERPIASLSVGDLVYSVDRGAIVAVPLIAVGRTRVASHHVMRIVLTDGAILEMSPGHPTADGRPFRELTAGAAIDPQHTVQSAELVPYAYDATYDVLPASSSGAYFASGALVASTLTVPRAAVSTLPW